MVLPLLRGVWRAEFEDVLAGAIRAGQGDPLRLDVTLVVGGVDDEPPQHGGVRIEVLPTEPGGLPVPERYDALERVEHLPVGWNS